MAKVDVDQGPMRWRMRRTKGLSRLFVRECNAPNTKPLPVTYYSPLRRRWFAAASTRRWLVTCSLIVISLIVTGALLDMGVTALSSQSGSGQTLFSLGFGAVDSRTLISAGLPQGGASGLVSAVLLANRPQAILSFLYLAYNGLPTCIFLSDEYSKYAVEGRRKPLRVTTPHGQQRKHYGMSVCTPF